MGVLDGQAVSAAITNPAFINKNIDDSMPNKLGFTRALSGSSIADIQAAVNKLYTATGASESQSGTTYNATPNTITNGDSHQTALTELADKFDPFTGHTHSGASGDGGPIMSSSITSVPFLGYIELAGAITGATGSSTDVSTILSGKSPSSGSTVAGIPITSPQNKALLFYGAGTNSGQEIVDSTGNLIYGRITHSGSVWTLSYYSVVSGSETAYSFSSSTNITWYYEELFNPLGSPPVYNDQLQSIGSNPTAAVIQATNILYGKVILSSSNPANVGLVAASGTANGTVANADHVHQGVHSLNAGASGNTYGDITLGASGGFQWNDQGQTKYGYAPPLSNNLAQSVGSANLSGSSLNSSRDDHVHEGVHSLAASGGSQLLGDVTLAASGSLVVSASGNQINIYGASVTNTTPQDVGTANSVGTATDAARADHVHKGMHSFASSGGSSLYGDVVIAASGGTALGQSGQNISIYSNPLSNATPQSVGSSNTVGTSLSVSRDDHAHQGVHSVQADNLGQLFGDVRIGASGGTQFAASGNGYNIYSVPLTAVAPQSVGSTNSAGSVLASAREDHVHQGVHSLAASGSSALFSDVVLAASGGMSIIQSGQTITFTAASGGGGTTSPLTTKGDLYGYDTANDRVPVGSDYQVLIPDAQQALGLRWATRAPGGSKNYIQYCDFENNATTGWSLGTVGTLTNNIPTGTPTFGSGASGNLSISTVSSGQLAGAYSLSYASSAASTQGNMLASQAFSLDIEDQAKVMTWKLYFKAVTNPTNGNFSGTSSNSFGIAAYDVTNSVWLPLTGNFAMTQNSGVGYATGTVQTGASTASIRFIVYNANASSGAITLYFDDFFFGPQTAPYGPVMTDWLAYIPTTQGMGTVSSNLFQWRRLGDSVQIQGQLTLGTCTAAQAQIGLPSGLTIGSILAANTNVGSVIDGTINNLAGITMIASGGNTYLNFSRMDNTNNPISPKNGNAIFADNTELTLTAILPVAGWSSNVQMSNDTDTRVQTLQYTGNGGTSITAGSTNIDFTTKVYDTHAAFSSNTTFTAPLTGFFQITGSVKATARQSLNLFAYKNGSQNILIGGINDTDNTAANIWPINGQIQLNAGDTLTVRSDTNITLSNSSTAHWLSVSRITGPAVIAATESVNAAYHTSSGTLSSSDSVTIYTVKDYDSHNAYSTGTGLYTCPISGKYRVTGQTLQSATYIAGNSASTGVWVNGTRIYRNITRIDVAVTDSVTCTFTGTVNVNAGDTIAIQSSNNGTSPSYSNDSALTYICIERVGN